MSDKPGREFFRLFEKIEWGGDISQYRSTEPEPYFFIVDGTLDQRILLNLHRSVEHKQQIDRIEVRWLDLPADWGGIAIPGDCEVMVGVHGTIDLVEPEFVPAAFKKSYKWKIVANRQASIESRFVTLAHELAHIYLGHLGPSWDGYSWPDRRTLPHPCQEFEAAVVSNNIAEIFGLKANAYEEARRWWWEGGAREFGSPDLSTLAKASHRIGFEAANRNR